MATRSEVIALARGWLDTPFHHQGRLKGVGVDCAGLLIGVATEAGLPCRDVDGYGAAPHARQVVSESDAQMDRITMRELLPADVLLFRVEAEPQHFGIVTATAPETYFIHAFQKVGRVTENRMDRFWRTRVVAVYRLRGLE